MTGDIERDIGRLTAENEACQHQRADLFRATDAIKDDVAALRGDIREFIAAIKEPLKKIEEHAEAIRDIQAAKWKLVGFITALSGGIAGGGHAIAEWFKGGGH